MGRKNENNNKKNFIESLLLNSTFNWQFVFVFAFKTYENTILCIALSKNDFNYIFQTILCIAAVPNLF